MTTRRTFLSALLSFLGLGGAAKATALQKVPTKIAEAINVASHRVTGERVLNTGVGEYRIEQWVAYSNDGPPGSPLPDPKPGERAVNSNCLHHRPKTVDGVQVFETHGETWYEDDGPERSVFCWSAIAQPCEIHYEERP